MKFLRRLLSIRASLPVPQVTPVSSVHSLTPVSRTFGFDRGRPIDRYYIEGFLARHTRDITGRVLEVGESSYTRRFGGDRVTQSDVLHAVPGNQEATIVGDLEKGGGIPHDAFNCMICTQTFSCIYDVAAAVRTACLALASGGVLLATLPGITQISRYDMDRWGDYWRFTDASARRLFGDVFGEANVYVSIYGNFLTACSLLDGRASNELQPDDLDYSDRDYQVLIGVRAVKQGNRC